MYTVLLKVDDRSAIADIVDAVKGKVKGIEIETESIEAEPQPRVFTPRPPRPAMERKPRRQKRGSKVNEALLNAMSSHPASIAALKVALTEAGKSAASLSTGIAALTKAGQIERVGDGMYALKGQEKQAAE